MSPLILISVAFQALSVILISLGRSPLEALALFLLSTAAQAFYVFNDKKQINEVEQIKKDLKSLREDFSNLNATIGMRL